MPLRLSLKPGERVIIGQTVVRNGEHRAEIWIENKTPILRETDILSPRDARSLCEQIYLALQLMYVDGDHSDEDATTIRVLTDEVLHAAPGLESLIQDILTLADSGQYYRALKRARDLLTWERETLNHAS